MNKQEFIDTMKGIYAIMDVMIASLALISRESIKIDIKITNSETQKTEKIKKNGN